MTKRFRVRGGAAICLSLAFACLGQAQQTINKGNTLSADSVGHLAPGVPFGCNVDGAVFKTLNDCVNFLTATGATGVGGVITENTPEHITALPWNPATFGGIVKLGSGPSGPNSGTCSLTALNCWLTEVPIILGKGMTLGGSGEIQAGASLNFANGTAIVAGPNFPTPLGQPTGVTLMCGTTGTGVTYRVVVVEVNNLDTNTGSTALKVPGLSAFSVELMQTCAVGSTLTVSSPTGNTGTNPLPAKDYRVFATSGATGTETLQIPNMGMGMTCAQGNVDPNNACALGASATITTLQNGGDFPNLIDLSNPLVVDIGGGGSSDGFWARLENLALVSVGPPANMSTAADNPNVAYVDQTDQENSGLGFVELVGEFGSTTDQSFGGGAWIYIGPHAPNSFLANVQSDIKPTGGIFTGLILDGRKGSGTIGGVASGTAFGTARVVYNSTFVPGRGGAGPTILAVAEVMGIRANVDFLDDHFEVNPNTVGSGPDCIQVTSGANVSAEGPEQLCGPFIHLYSNTTSPTGVAGNDITVRNITSFTPTLGPAVVVQDDVNNVMLSGHVSDYSTAKNTASMNVQSTLNLVGSASGTVSVKPQTAAGTYEFDMPTTAGMVGQVLTSQAGNGTAMTWTTPTTGTVTSVSSGNLSPLFTSSVANPTTTPAISYAQTNQNANLIYAGPSSGGAAAPTFRALAAADLPTGGTVQVLGAGANLVTPPVYVAWLGGAGSGSSTLLSPMIASGGTMTDLFVGVISAYGASTGVTFRVASCTPSGGVNCTAADSSVTCTISGATQTQCSDSAHTLSLHKGDEVFVHLTVSAGSPGSKNVYMSYRLTGVQ